ncbi:MAG: glucose-6-phosphate isomerase [Anaerolineales bacterium]|nr:glucose-6-phosphate isomerase [Anaerolineales bacterium]
MSPFLSLPLQLIQFDPDNPNIPGASLSARYLSDMAGYFADEAAFYEMLAKDDPILYQVYNISPTQGEGDLNYGIGVLMPGQVGAEYYLTKGHLHRWREAAEIYIGLSGEGFMLLEDEATRESRLIPFLKNSIIYVPGHTAHRTINTGTKKLTYIGIYPANAGHDYGFVKERGFDHILVSINGEPELSKRQAFVDSLKET